MVKGTVKKKNRKLRKQIRKTVGALFMISAIVVAAIPVQDVRANPGDSPTEDNKFKVAVVNSWQESDRNNILKPYTSTIPDIQSRGGADPLEEIVYTSGDGTFQFIYARPDTSKPNKVAIIVGYNTGVLPDGALNIPENLEAYRKYTDNVSRSGYCLVSKNDNILYYESNEQKKDEYGYLMYRVPGIIDETTKEPLEVNQYDTHIQKDENGKDVYVRQEDKGETDENNNPVMTDVSYELVPIMETVYYPCYYEQKSKWEGIADTDLYYNANASKPGEEPSYQKAGQDQNYWKISADVAYIGGEKIKDDGDGGWKLDGYIEAPADGIFAGENNITNLTVGSNILGISDYAFYSCATLNSVSLANGLQVIGNGAFAECINLASCNIDPIARIEAIGKDAFFNCRNLGSFTAPIGLRALGDSCFEGCTNLTSIDLIAGGTAQVALQTLGNNLFKDCTRLAAVEFPETYKEDDLSLSMFSGCSSLQYVKAPNEKINFYEKGADGNRDEEATKAAFEAFKKTVPASFYFEGPGGSGTPPASSSNIHNTASEYFVAFKYLGQELYEIVMLEKGKFGEVPGDVRVTYQVNNNNELVKFQIEKNGSPENVTIPETIGPYGIASIGSGSFNNGDCCELKRITIPASVSSIGNEAFKGCHGLATVIFTDAATMQTIGTDAFKTQEITACSHKTVDDPENAAYPSLTFVGAMYNPATGADTVPFVYAMNGVSNINNGNQEKIWITCHSGWPTNMEVEYNYNPVTAEGEAQFIKYPKYSDLKDNAEIWLGSLPYITDDNKEEYETRVTEAVKKYENYKADNSYPQPTENEMAIINSALNIVVPNSVDSIKTGIFSNTKEDGTELADGGYLNDKIESIVLNGVKEVAPYTFKGCTALKNVSVIGPSKIDDYVFDGCTALETATLGANLTETGMRPFRGCTKLTNIECLGSNFSYGNGVLFQNTEGGKTIVECLEGRGNTIGSPSVGPDEFAGVTAIKEEAFRGCGDVGKVDLSASTVDVIPERCFQDMKDLNSVVLPDTVKNIEADSFKDCGIRLLTIPGNQAFIAKDAFKSSPNQQKIIFECVEGTTADRYAKAVENSYITPEYGKVFLTHTVYFWDYPDYPDRTNKTLFDKQSVKDGEDAKAPATNPVHEGYTFSGWTDYTNISRDTDVYPEFGSEIYTVKFLDWDTTQIGETQYIEEGKSATAPEDPVREGYTFTGWLPDYHNVTKDITVIAQYTDNSGSTSRHTVTFYNYDGSVVVATMQVDHGGTVYPPAAPARSGYKFLAWVPSTFTNITQDMTVLATYDRNASSGATASPGNGGSNNNGNATSSPSPTPTAAPGATPRTYTVSVSGGSGSGSYAAGAIVSINAYVMGEGQNFDKWTTSTAGVGFASNTSPSTTFTMPAANVAVTATYKTGSGTTANTGGGSTGTGNTAGSGTGSGSSAGGTTVEVSKPGISNQNLAGATVAGSTDNFVVKITEDQASADAAVAALQAKYGDISRIKYLPMDISLYDSTGRTKIADTSGISVNITLPLPDDLIQYAGNNKIASTAGNVLEDLNSKFTTIDGVPCINFTASHFSPYVVYVDTANLTEATIDATPKTGDPIHPKWFLATGLACIALILFFKRDKAIVRTKAA